jgi:hypothetical protein
MIASGPISLPSDRFAASEIVDFPNIISYTSYKLIFPTIKDGGLAAMQVADGQLFTGLGGSGVGVLAESDFAIAVNNDPMDFSSFPAAERPENVIDGTFDKYLNFGYFNSGFIVSRADDARVIINGFTITTANDFFERDPSSYEIYGTNDPVTSGQNSTGQDENWILVAFGDLDLPEDRFTESEFVSVDNSAGYSAYRVLFPTIRLPANSMQIGEMTFTGKLDKSGCDFEVGDVNLDGIVSLLDVDPFVTLISAGGFQCEAEINEDGSVSLLDVDPFVQLLTGP